MCRTARKYTYSPFFPQPPGLRQLVMQYSLYTRGREIDYKWSSPPDLNWQEYLKNGVLAYRRIDGTFSVYLNSEAIEKEDIARRNIRIGVLITGCSEAKAKGLVVWALEHWDKFADTFTPFVNDFGADEWTDNRTAVEHWVNSVTEIAAAGIPFDKRYENGNTAESRKALIADLKKFDFSPKAGFKLAADGDLMTGSNLKILQSQVERYLSKDKTLKTLQDESAKQPPKKTSGMSTATFTLAILLVLFIGGGTGFGFWFYKTVFKPKGDEIVNLNAEIRKLEENMPEYQAWVAKKGKINALDSQIKDKQDAVNRLDSEFTAKKTKLEEEIGKLNNEKEKIANQLNESSTSVKILGDDIKDKKKELQDLQIQIKDAKKELQKLQSQIKDAPGQPPAGQP
jgi:hypothetical protein